MTSPTVVRHIAAPAMYLGEGPAWDAHTRTLSWIDIEEGRVFAAHYDGELSRILQLEIGGVVGCALPIASGGYLVSLECWIGILHPDGRLEKSRPLISTGRRFNDGKIDPQGRFVVGSLRRGIPDGKQLLIRIEHDGTVTVLDEDLEQSNGVAWSPDGDVFYNADTSRERIYRRSYVDGVAGRREIFLELDGRPDGITSDTDGNLWVTIFDGERVDCYSPGGERQIDRTIELSGYHPSSVEFVGPKLDELLITTGFPRLDDDADLSLRTALDGAILVARPGATGVPATPWRPAPLPA